MFGRRFESAHLHKQQKLSLNGWAFSVCGELFQPLALRGIPFQGSKRSARVRWTIVAQQSAAAGRVPPLLQLFYKSLADSDDSATCTGDNSMGGRVLGKLVFARGQVPLI